MKMIVLFKLLVSVSLLGFLLFFVDFSALLASILSIDARLYALSIILYFTSQVINSVKWKFLLPELALSKLFIFTFVGVFYSTVLPSQVAGEIAKTWRLARGNRLAERIAASVFVDRVTGLIGLLLLATGGALLAQQPEAQYLVKPAIMMILVLVAIIFFPRITFLQKAVRQSVHWLSNKTAFLQNQAPKAIRLLDQLSLYSRSVIPLVISIGIGVVFQAVSVAIIYTLAMGLNIKFSYFDMTWILCIISLMTLLPISIAGIGVRELGFVGLLGLLGVSIELALTISLLLFSIQIIGALIGALFELLQKPSA